MTHTYWDQPFNHFANAQHACERLPVSFCAGVCVWSEPQPSVSRCCVEHRLYRRPDSWQAFWQAVFFCFFFSLLIEGSQRQRSQPCSSSSTILSSAFIYLSQQRENGMFGAKFIAVRSGPNNSWMGFKCLERFICHADVANFKILHLKEDKMFYYRQYEIQIAISKVLKK